MRAQLGHQQPAEPALPPVVDHLDRRLSDLVVPPDVVRGAERPTLDKRDHSAMPNAVDTSYACQITFREPRPGREEPLQAGFWPETFEDLQKQVLVTGPQGAYDDRAFGTHVTIHIGAGELGPTA